MSIELIIDKWSDLDYSQTTEYISVINYLFDGTFNFWL